MNTAALAYIAVCRDVPLYDLLARLLPLSLACLDCGNLYNIGHSGIGYVSQS